MSDIDELRLRFKDAHYALHRCWTKAVDAPDYVKADWIILDNALSRQFCDAAKALGYSGPMLDNPKAATSR